MRRTKNNDGTEDDGKNPLDVLPEALVAHLGPRAAPDGIRAWAAIDLDAEGNYVEEYLVLTDGRLGHFARADGAWRQRWLDATDFSRAEIVEGLGMSLLRLRDAQRVLGEYRYTLRHARSVAKLHRQIERMLGRETSDEAPAAPHGEKDEKKLRCEKCGRVIPAWADTCPACRSRGKILFRLLGFLRPYKYRATFGFLLAVGITCVGLIQPGLIKPIIDDGLIGGDYNVLLRYVGIMAGLILLIVVGRNIQQRLVFRMGTMVTRDVRDRVYAHLHTLSLSFFAKKQTGGLVTRVTTDSDRLWQFLAFAFVDVILSFLTIFGVGVALFLMHWKLALFALLPIPVMLLLLVVFHKMMHRIFRRMWHRWSQMTAVVADALPGVRVIKAFSQEDREIERFAGKSAAVCDEEMKFISCAAMFGPIMMFCSQLSVIIIWLLGGWWVIQGPLKVGTLMAFTGYLAMFMRPIHMIAHMDEMLNRAATSAQRIFEILDTEPTIFSQADPVAPESLDGKIELQDVSFSYDGVRKVLKNVNLLIEPGRMIGLAGPSGGGKTTMVNLICRFYDVLEGRILIDGVDVRDYDVETLRLSIGVVLQEPFLFHGTVAENIAYGNPGASLERIIESARAANAHEFIVAFPDGYDTLVGERGQALSGGERQRISIARAILNNPRILILDEATSSVDTETESLIQEALDRLVADRTTIAIAHRLSTLRKADHLVILDKGSIIEEGTHEELAAHEDGLYSKLLHMQSETRSVMAI